MRLNIGGIGFGDGTNRGIRRHRHGPGSPIVGIIFGLVFMGISSVIFMPTYRIITTGTTATGTVKEIVTTKTKKGGTAQHPKIEFTTENGQKIEFTTATTTILAPSRVGQTVNVIYEKDNPANASINDFVNLWLFPGIFFLTGLAIVVFSVLGIINKPKDAVNVTPESFTFTPPPNQPLT